MWRNSQKEILAATRASYRRDFGLAMSGSEDSFSDLEAGGTRSGRGGSSSSAQ